MSVRSNSPAPFVRSCATALSVLAIAACNDPVRAVDASIDAATVLDASQDAKASAKATEVLPLPLGFSPEGIAFGRGGTYYVGSVSSGAIYRGDARTGTGAVLVQGTTGNNAVGLWVDQRDQLFVSGGPTGRATVYDASTGALLASYQLASAGGFVNDVIVTKDAAFFTNSFAPVIYRVPVERSGRLDDANDVATLPLTGDFTFVPGAFNANGIVATPNGKSLILVNSATGTLYLVDPETGVADAIDLGGATVVGGDGLLLDGRTLYVVQGASNQVSVVTLRSDLSTGSVTSVITSSSFRYPTTVAEFGSSLYVVNGRFDVAPPPAPAPGVEFEVVRVPKR